MSEQVHPALSPERESYRGRYAVRLIQADEEGHDLHSLPEGVYGFTTAAGSEELPVFIKPIFRCFEVHKLAGGEICYVGYLTEKEYQALQNGSEPITIVFYPEPHEESTKISSVPLSRIDRAKAPSRDDGNFVRMEVGPKREYMSVSSRVN